MPVGAFSFPSKPITPVKSNTSWVCQGHNPGNLLASPTNLILRVLPEIAVVPGVTNDLSIGFAVGSYATVSFRWAREAADLVGVMPSEILTIVPAHEIGHLLLGPSHSPRGIMHASWSREDFARAQLGAFLFTTQQAKQMRAEVMRRAEEQGVAHVATTAPTK
jgi:hypothetical protein